MKKIALFGMALLLSVSDSPSFADSVVGTGTPASCTQQALQNSLDGGGIVTFNCGPQAHTISMTAAGWIAKDTVLDGGGLITLDGRSKNIVLELQGDHEPDLVVTIKNLSIINGANDFRGGGIYAKSRVTLDVDNVVFAGNKASHSSDCTMGGGMFVGYASTIRVNNSIFSNNAGHLGGAIGIIHSDLRVTNSYFEGNRSELNYTTTLRTSCNPGGGGGAVYIDGARPIAEGGTNSADSLYFLHNKFISNYTNYLGGAIFINVYDSDAALIDSNEFEGNFSKSPHGAGAVWYSRQNSTKKLAINNSLFLNNGTTSYAGAVYADAPAIITNSTFMGNYAVDPDNAKEGLGGAISAGAGSEITNSTLIYNRAGLLGGAILGGSPGDSTDKPKLTNTIIAYNTTDNGEGMNCSRNVKNGGGNLQYPSGSTYSCIANLTAVEPGLGTLKTSSGFTRVVAPLIGSAAVDAGVDTACPSTDQRGSTRPRDGNGDGSAQCDIGAVELDSAAGVPTQSNAMAYHIASGQLLSSSAVFTPVLNAANGQSGNYLSISASTALNVDMHVQVQSSHVGQAASIVLLAAYTYGGQTLWFTRNGANWELWNGQLTGLRIADQRAALSTAETFSIAQNLQGLPGQFLVYVGYLLADSTVVYNQAEAIQFQVN